MIASALLLSTQNNAQSPAYYAKTGIIQYSEVQNADQNGRPAAEFNGDNAYVSVSKKFILISDSDDLVPEENGERNRGEIEVNQLMRQYGGNTGPQSFLNGDKTFPGALFTRITDPMIFVDRKTRVVSNQIFGARHLEKDERELIFACIVLKEEIEKRTFNHVIYSRTDSIKHLSFQVFYTSTSFWFNPYTGMRYPITVAQPEWPRASAQELPQIFERFPAPMPSD